jgi:hypothetical protein
VSHRTLTAGALAVAIAVSCTALAGATAERTAQAKVVRHVIVVRGEPFFPVMLIDQCTQAATARAHRLGVNLVLNENCPDAGAGRQLANLHRKQVGVLKIEARNTRGARLAGFTFPDEPDNNGWTPERLARAFPYKRGNSDGLLSFMTTTGRFFRPPYRNTSVSPLTTRAFARLADVAGFDLYPLNTCQSDLSAIYDAQRQFGRLAGAMPTFQWIETGAIRPSYCGGFAMTPTQLTAEAWLAVAGGARGIGFFTHTWSPQHSDFGVSPGVAGAIGRFTRLASAVRPGLLGQTVLSGADSSSIKLLARRGAGRTYLFAINTAAVPVTAKMHVPRLHDGRMAAFGEKRSVDVAGDRFSDWFGPLAVHIYVQKS